MSKILITGGSGLVGRAISKLLLNMNKQPVWLSREEGMLDGIRKYRWNLEKNYIDENAFEDIEGIIHLAGAGIVDHKWTTKYKKEILDSRVKSSELLFNYVSKKKYPINYIIGGSAIGYYGSSKSDNVFTEEGAPGNDVIIRTGIVLSSEGGAYKKMVIPFKFGMGAAIASGKQFFPWIHINDLANIFIHAAFNNITGIYNGVGSEIITNKEFSRQLAKSLKKPFFLPNVPESALKLIMGEMAITFTEGLKISNQKIKNAGYVFEYENVKDALNSFS
jgi:NAD dependent epimerase/dehydratase family enzyme